MKAASRAEDMQELNAVIAVRSTRNGAGLTGLPQPDERQQADTSLTADSSQAVTSKRTSLIVKSVHGDLPYLDMEKPHILDIDALENSRESFLSALDELGEVVKQLHSDVNDFGLPSLSGGQRAEADLLLVGARSNGPCDAVCHTMFEVLQKLREQEKDLKTGGVIHLADTDSGLKHQKTAGLKHQNSLRKKKGFVETDLTNRLHEWLEVTMSRPWLLQQFEEFAFNLHEERPTANLAHGLLRTCIMEELLSHSAIVAVIDNIGASSGSIIELSRFNMRRGFVEQVLTSSTNLSKEELEDKVKAFEQGYKIRQAWLRSLSDRWTEGFGLLWLLVGCALVFLYIRYFVFELLDTATCGFHSTGCKGLRSTAFKHKSESWACSDSGCIVPYHYVGLFLYAWLFLAVLIAWGPFYYLIDHVRHGFRYHNEPKRLESKLKGLYLDVRGGLAGTESIPMAVTCIQLPFPNGKSKVQTDDGLISCLLEGASRAEFASPVMRAVIQWRWETYSSRMHLVELCIYTAVFMPLLSITALSVSNHRGNRHLILNDQLLYSSLWVCWGFNLRYLLQEWHRRPISTLLFHHIFRNVWNVIDIFTHGVIFCIVFAVQFNADPSNVLSLCTIAVVMACFKLLNFLRPYKWSGPLVEMIVCIMFDMAPFVFILFIVCLGFTLGFFVLIQQPDMAWSSWGDSSLSIFYMLVGDFGPVADGQIAASANPQVAKVLFVTFVMLTSVVLLNLLIAIMGDSYEKVFERKITSWQSQKSAIILDAELLNCNEHYYVLKLGRYRKMLNASMIFEDLEYKKSKTMSCVLRCLAFLTFALLVILPWAIVISLRSETETSVYKAKIEPWGTWLSIVYALLVIPFGKIPLFQDVQKWMKTKASKQFQEEEGALFNFLVRAHRVHFLLFWLTIVIVSHEIVAVTFGLAGKLYRTPSLFGVVWEVPRQFYSHEDDGAVEVSFIMTTYQRVGQMLWPDQGALGDEQEVDEKKSAHNTCNCFFTFAYLVLTTLCATVTLCVTVTVVLPSNFVASIIIWLTVMVCTIMAWFFYTPPAHPSLPKYLYILAPLDVARDKGQSEWTGSMAWTKKELTKTIISKTATLDGKMEHMDARLERIESLLISIAKTTTLD